MKKILLLSFAILMLGALNAQNNQGKKQKGPVKDFQVIKFFNKTNDIIKVSFDQVKENKVYTGGIAAAKDFQKIAMDEFKNNENQKAINDSYTARRLAFRAYMENSGEKDVKSEWKLNEMEQKLVSIQISPEEIDEILENFKKAEEDDGFNLDDLEDIENENKVNDNSKGKMQKNK
ncbi:MAG: hypothetical protein JXL97_09245 [Bacteroidales bacterium]|nr:hypothetical protein [Bacteroidales bacterium]